MHSFQKPAFAKTLSLHRTVYILLLALPCAASV
ncbi:putative membrane chloride channel (bestrophin family) [Edaphobacter lichenicola]|uniref:Membrane chloride channel (Bestrophin family) n=1 Tax=Tunturiibacter lichenicola TaxID=2051959 RepID=A0A7W8N7E6_9BACT|nr:putative membrane chloride channel (bestrophin family) [Edaphobacter lichenicola]